jgi:hypothetical protein
MVEGMARHKRTTLIVAGRAVALVVVLFGLVLIPVAEAPAREATAPATDTTSTSPPAGSCVDTCPSPVPANDEAQWYGTSWYGTSWYGTSWSGSSWSSVTFPAFWE